MFGIHYDPTVPGCLVDSNGNQLCSLTGEYYTYHGAQAYRIVWEGFNGKIPEGFLVDHINRDKLDNRIENLRLATKSQNGHNCDRPKKDGLPRGIVFRGKTYRAYITVDKVNHSCVCDTLEEAIAWRNAKGIELLGEFYTCISTV